MAHDHQHTPARYGRAFAIGVALNLGFVAIEAGYGLYAHSLALVADAGHNLSDVLGLLIAWGALVLTGRAATQQRTYGYRRSSILAALINAVLLLLAVGGILWEAIRRFGDPGPVAGGTVILVALAGIVVNGITAALFMSGRAHDLNLRGAFLHMAADAGVSLGVVLAGLAILATGWTWLDPAVGVLIAAGILAGTWGLLRASVNLALDAVPDGIAGSEVARYLATLPSVLEVHDLHIWGMSTTETALTAHLMLRDVQAGDALLARVSAELHDQFGIEHTTIQLEPENTQHPCRSCQPATKAPPRP